MIRFICEIISFSKISGVISEGLKNPKQSAAVHLQLCDKVGTINKDHTNHNKDDDNYAGLPGASVVPFSCYAAGEEDARLGFCMCVCARFCS